MPIIQTALVCPFFWGGMNIMGNLVRRKMGKEKQIHYQSRGARAMVFLHEHYLREFFDVWKKAKTTGVALPETSHSADVSFEMLLQQVFECARHLMEWMCETLELPDLWCEEP